MIDIIPFKSKHAEFILNQQMNDPALELSPQHKKYALFLEQDGTSFTALVNGKPIASGGVYVLWDNVAEGWVLATSEIWNYKLRMAMIFKKKTENLIKQTKIKRLQTAVKANFELGHKFAKYLGLEQEGLMRHYGPDGSDYIRYARIIT